MNETDKLRLEAQEACSREDVMRSLTTADELLRREPADVDAMFIAGTALLTGGQEGLAALVLNSARCATKDPIKLGPICNNIACALQEYQPEEAYRWFKESLKHGTPPPSVYDNLCNVASALGRHAEALEWASKSTAVDASFNRSFALMHLGRWAEAWKSYARSVGLSCRPLTDRTYDLPRWDGKRPGRLIIHGEQGVGDEIMFMSMCPADFDGVIDCNPRTADLFARSFPKAKVYGTLLQDYVRWPLDERCDYHLEMGGLGEFFAPEPFRRGGFLTADSARVAGWLSWIDAKTCAADLRLGRERDRVLVRGDPQHRAGRGSVSLRVGLAWTGGTWSTGRAKRSIPFELIAEKLIKQHPDVTFVNLEYEDRKDELAPYPQVLNPHWATRKGADLDDLAALVSSLDLVITATNSTVDLCGALGVPVWALVNAEPQWRYSEAAGEDQMWFYESARTFRQKPADGGKWDRVLSNATTALHKLKAPKPAPVLEVNGRDNDAWVSC